MYLWSGDGAMVKLSAFLTLFSGWVQLIELSMWSTLLLGPVDAAVLISTLSPVPEARQAWNWQVAIPPCGMTRRAGWPDYMALTRKGPAPKSSFGVGPCHCAKVSWG